jgi:hypothetical protein
MNSRFRDWPAPCGRWESREHGVIVGVRNYETAATSHSDRRGSLDEQNDLDFQALVEHANTNLKGEIDFAVLRARREGRVSLLRKSETECEYAYLKCRLYCVCYYLY